METKGTTFYPCGREVRKGDVVFLEGCDYGSTGEVWGVNKRGRVVVHWYEKYYWSSNFSDWCDPEGVQDLRLFKRRKTEN